MATAANGTRSVRRIIPERAADYFRRWFELTFQSHVRGDRDATFFDSDLRLSFEKGYLLGKRHARRG